MKTPTSDDAQELIRLAVRMGIPPAEAIRRVMDHLSELRTADAGDLSPSSNLVDPNDLTGARGRARMRLLPGGGEVSAQRFEDPSPTTGSSASA